MDPAAPGHQPSSNGLLPAFDGNTKPSAAPTRDPGARLRASGILCQICVFGVGARPTHQRSGEAVMTDRGVTIVTGGASGIGLAIAKALLGEGWKVIIADLAQGPLDAARAQLEPIRANATKCVIMDVANEASVLAALDGCEDGFGPVRGLVNSAGIGRDTPFFETSVEVFRKVLDINLTGTFTVAREACKLMRGHGGGAVVNIASISGQRGNLGRSAYGASKGGVITLTQVMACELAPENIRVNAIAP